MSRTSCSKRLWMCLLAPLAYPGVSLAELAAEVIDLQAGWNAVWVNLAPVPSSLSAILKAQTPPLDYESIWTFDSGGVTPSTENVQAATRWFFHARGVPASIGPLTTLFGHRAYLIKMNSPGQLRLTGDPLVRSTTFSSRVSNLFGALTKPTNESPYSITFEHFFSHPNARGKIRSSGTPVRHDIFAMVGGNLVRRTLFDPIQPNAAYWLDVVQEFVYAGPLNVTDSANGLAFGRSTAFRTLSIEVPAAQSPRRITLQARACADLSPSADCSGDTSSVAWIQYRDRTRACGADWCPLSAGYSFEVPDGTTRVEVELRAHRVSVTALAAARNTAGEDDGIAVRFPLVIDVTDDDGSRAVVASDVSVEPIFGTWVGRVALDRVSAYPVEQVNPSDEPETPSPLGMTLILELRSPTAVAGGAAHRILDALEIVTHRDGQPLLRRFSSVLFDRPVELGTVSLDPFGASGTLTQTLHISPKDPLNPYRHRYNPEHRKGYDITRVITIKIERQLDRLSDVLAGLDGTFGPHRLAGQYTERISGLTVQPIVVHGEFRLDRLLGESTTVEAAR